MPSEKEIAELEARRQEEHYRADSKEQHGYDKTPRRLGGYSR